MYRERVGYLTPVEFEEKIKKLQILCQLGGQKVTLSTMKYVIE